MPPQLQSQPIQIQMGGGGPYTWAGWVASPVPAATVVNVTVWQTNPDAGGPFSTVPQFTGIATEAGPHSPNGALLFGYEQSYDPVTGTTGPKIDPNFKYGATVWYYQ